jgi:hypothetical protein
MRLFAAGALLAGFLGVIGCGGGNQNPPGPGATSLPLFTNSARKIQEASQRTNPRALAGYGRLPLTFEVNEGQTDGAVKYLARGRGYTLFLTSTESVLSLAGGERETVRKKGLGTSRKPQTYPRLTASAKGVVRMQMLNADPNPRLTASELQPGISNYLLGRDRRRWHTGVRQWGRVGYDNVYPGINLFFHGEQRLLEFDFVLAPGADASLIELRFGGADAIKVDDGGNLVLSASSGGLTLHKPIAYQKGNGPYRAVDARFEVTDGKHVRFSLGDYDRNRELVIDPTLVYSTYLGGSGDDIGFGIAVDSSGNAYVTGTTNSASFPGASGSPAGSYDAFVTKLNAGGNGILYSTFLGGSSDDGGTAIALDSSLNLYIAGSTSSSNFPVTSGAAQTGFGGVQDGFVSKLNSTGSALIYATYVGGSGSDSANAIAVDGSGNAYISGGEQSMDFPTTPGAFQTTTSDGLDAFVAKLNASGTTFLYSTYLGGNTFDTAHGIALVTGCIASCNAFVVGDAGSSDFPVKNAFDSTFESDDAFVAQLNSAGSGLVYSTFLGGGDIEQAFGITLDSSGAAYVTGYTLSDDFPVVNAFQPELLGFADGFVTKLKPDGSGLIYSSYLGSGDEGGLSIAVDGHGNAYVVGVSRTDLFPLVDPLQSSLQGNSDAFVTMVDPTGGTKVYSTYFGGDGDDNYKQPTGDLFGSVALDSSGAVYLTGRTTSSGGFPTASPLQASFGGGAADAYVAKLAPAPNTPDLSVDIFPDAWLVSSGQSTGDIVVTVTPLNGFSGTVNLACSGLPTYAACSFNPASVASSGKSTLTISTRQSAAQAMSIKDALIYGFGVFLPIGGLMLMGGSLALNNLFKRKLLCFFVLSALILLPACGGYNGGGGGGGGGGATTAPGTYSVTVTGSSGGSSHEAIFTLIVQ